jgi:protease-4
MPLSADNILDRIKLKSEVVKWRTLTIVIATLLAVVLVAKSSNLYKAGADSIARVSIEGIILENRDRDAKLEEIKNNNRIKAVILYINSPGGTIVGGENLYYAIRSISEVKPVVAVMGSIAASGGYMTAIAADYIVARTGTITGSVGVILESFEVTELAKKIGINPIMLKSGELKGSPSPFEKPNPKAEKVLMDSVQDSYNFFVDLVKDRRMLSEQNIAVIADGRVFTGKQALANKLIDSLGGEKEAIGWLAKEKNIDTKLPVKDIDLEPEKKLWEKIYTKVMGSNAYIAEFSGSGIMALWRP